MLDFFKHNPVCKPKPRNGVQSNLFCVSVDTHSFAVGEDSIFDAAKNNLTALSLEYAFAGGYISQFIYRTVKFTLLSFNQCLSSFDNEAIRYVVVYLGEELSWDFETA